MYDRNRGCKVENTLAVDAPLVELRPSGSDTLHSILTKGGVTVDFANHTISCSILNWAQNDIMRLLFTPGALGEVWCSVTLTDYGAPLLVCLDGVVITMAPLALQDKEESTMNVTFTGENYSLIYPCE